MLAYTEVQQNKARWYSTTFNAVFLTIGFVWMINEHWLVGFDTTFHLICYCVFCGLLYMLPTSFMFFQRLDTKIDDTGVYIRTPLKFAKWQHLPWTEIDKIYVREYALLGEYPKGILGFRQGPNGFAFAPLYGVYGLQIEKASGGRYLLGTQRPDELKQFLMNCEAANPVSPA